ncbi:MAG TPA: site-specific integrase [Acidimicrobiales bacterium]|nr:site-specific integrase [Acidimicrobiales bacterium]
MASVRRKPSGGWEARYRDGAGVMHARTFPTKAAATRWSREMETDLSRGDWVDPRLGRTTFGRWAEEYLTTIVHLRAVTRGDYERHLRVHILPVFGDRPVAQITQVDVRRFVAERRAAGLAPKTLQKIRLVLRQVLETARSAGAIRANPCDGVRIPRAQAKEPLFLSADEVEALARATRPPYDLLVRFAAATGLRPSELCGLRVGRLNLVRGLVEVAEALTVVAGHTEVGPIKNGVRRTVQLSRSLCDDLGRHLAGRAASLGRSLDPDDFVFVAPEGGPLRRDLFHKRIFRPAVEQAGLPARLRVHDLRHTCASLLIDLGAHPKVIQEWLGHKSITVTIDVYGHLFPSLSEALAERLDELFRQAADRPPAPVPTVVDLGTARRP